MVDKSQPSVVQPRLASAIMLLRDMPGGQGIEVFMVRRVIQSDFMPDVYVFPGGSVSKDDRAAEQTEGICIPVAPAIADPEGRTILGSGARAAAIRELFEEAGVLLAYRGEEILAIPETDVARFAAYRQAFNQRKGSLVEMAHVENLWLATDRLGYFAHWIGQSATNFRWSLPPFTNYGNWPRSRVLKRRWRLLRYSMCPLVSLCW